MDRVPAVRQPQQLDSHEYCPPLTFLMTRWARTAAFVAASISPAPRTHLRKSAFTALTRPSRPAPPFRPSARIMATAASLDTDAAGGVLMAPRDGAVAIHFGKGISAYTGDVLVCGAWAPEDDDAELKLGDTLSAFDASVGGALSDAVADAEFKAKIGSSTEVVRLGGGSLKRVVLFGLGKESAGVTGIVSAAKFAVQKGIAIKGCESVGLFVDGMDAEGVAAAAEGAIVGGYVDERYKEKKETSKVPAALVLVGVESAPKLENAVKRGCAIAAGILTTKEVVSAPANTLTPATLAIAAETVAKECGLDIKVMGREECEKLGMGSYLGVGRGSTDEPKFIHMAYKPDGPAKKKLCIVGKAVTFDTGGTNLKGGGGSLELMKFDMGGSGVALGTAKIIGTLKPKDVEVHFIMPAVENMLSDRAIHPGDVLKASNGKTIEVINTDAEGRLCLADALVYAENLGDVDYIVDFATLTGAIIVSLGNEVTGMWSTSDELAEALVKSGKACGEQVWRMPLVDEYAEQLKSKIADLRNIGAGRAGSSITAALFLREFVKTKNWAHMDIAGTAWNEKKGGATAHGVKTMVHWIESFVSSE